MKKNQKGITIIALIITIIVMLILTSVTIYVGTGSIENSRVISFVTYMQTIQTKVDFIAQNEDYSNYGEALPESFQNKLQLILDSETENFVTTANSTYLRYFDSDHIALDLEIDNIDDQIVVDFNTREVISLNGVKYEGEMYYTQYNLPTGQVLKQQTENTNRSVTIGNVVSVIDGLNATFTIKNIGITNGTLSCGKEYVNEESQTVIKWTEITNYTIRGENYITTNITESGKYYFKLVDNITGEDSADSEGNYLSVELSLTNSPKLQGTLIGVTETYNYSDLNDSTKWAYANDQTNQTYVWIPRFVYKLDENGTLDELQFLRGTSDVTSSGTYINNTDWIEPNAFTNGVTKKTGVWVQVDEPKQTRCRYN